MSTGHARNVPRQNDAERISRRSRRRGFFLKCFDFEAFQRFEQPRFSSSREGRGSRLFFSCASPYFLESEGLSIHVSGIGADRHDDLDRVIALAHGSTRRFQERYRIPYGPGLLTVSHGPNEFAPIRNIVRCTAIYALTAAEMWADPAL